MISVLICTVPGRVTNFLPQCLENLLYQAQGKPVQIIYLGDNHSMTVGEKRNHLVSMAKGDYIAFVDDDDRVTEDYIDSLLKATQSGADVICFQAYRHHNGQKDRLVKYDLNYLKDSNHKSHYERLPNHLMCFKKKVAVQVPFPHLNYGEDAAWAAEVKKVTRTQHLIKRVLYHYFFNQVTTETQKF